MVQYLLNQGQSRLALDVVSEKGTNALHIACIKENYDVINPFNCNSKQKMLEWKTFYLYLDGQNSGGSLV